MTSAAAASSDGTLITVTADGEITSVPVTIVHAPGTTPSDAPIVHHCGPGTCGRRP